MRRWLIAGGVGAAIGIAVVAFALHRLSRALEANRAWIEARAEVAVGRPVRFERIGVSLSSGLGVRVTALRVAEDPRIGDGDFLRAEAVQVAVRLWPALWGRWEVRRVLVDRPEVVLVRTSRGLNLDSLGEPAPAVSPRTARLDHAAGVGAVVDGPRGGAPAVRRATVVRSAARAGPPAAGRAPASGTALARLAGVSVARLTVRDGTLRWVDRTVEPPLELLARRLDLEASDLSLATPIAVDVQAALFAADRHDVRVQGTIGPIGLPPALEAVPVDVGLTADGVALGAVRAVLPGVLPDGPRDDVPLGGRVRLTGVPQALAVDARLAAGRLAVVATGTVAAGAPPQADLAIEVPRVALAELAPLVPALQGAGVSGSLESNLRVRGPLGFDALPALTGTVGLTEAAFGPEGPAGITTTIRIDGDLLELPPTRVEIADAAMQVATRVRREGREAWFDPVRIEGFGGIVQASGRLDARDPARPRLDCEGSARELSAAKVLAVRAPEMAERVQGRVDADFVLTASGRTAEAMRRSLGGTARVVVTQAVIRGFNMAESVLDGVTGGIRGLVTLVPPRLRSKHPELFGAAQTRIDELRARVRLAGRVARVDELVATAREWAMTGTGTVELGGPLDLRGTFTASRALTADVVEAVREARWVLDDAGRLAVPFRLTGTPPDLRTVPDPAFVARALERALLEHGLGSPPSGEPGRRRERDGSVQDMIRRGLDQLLGR